MEPRREIDIVLHGSDSLFGNAATVALWHGLPKPQGNGWKTIGYHRVVLNGWIGPGLYDQRFDGHIETGRPINSDGIIEPEERGAHVYGHNEDTFAICMIGKSGQYTDKQILTVYSELELLELQFIVRSIKQHSDLDPVNKPHCAGLNMAAFLKGYNKYKNN